MFWHLMSNDDTSIGSADVGHTPSEPDRPRVGTASENEAPEWNEFAADLKGSDDAFSRRALGGLAHGVRRSGVPLEVQTRGAGFARYDELRDRVATQGRQAAQETAGVDQSYGMSWSEAIEPTIRPGMALGRRRMVGYNPAVQNGASQDVRGVQASGGDPWLAGLQSLANRSRSDALSLGLDGLKMNG